MRPIRRGTSPQTADFDDYEKAKPVLVSRLGGFCSYCERPIKTNLAVEHVQPKKGPYGYPLLMGRWSNFLLACVNCNSTKKDKQVVLDNLLLPDRDNTFLAFRYLANGKIQLSPQLNSTQNGMAADLLSLVGLDKAINRVTDENGRQVSIDRVSQRMEAWGKAELSKQNLQIAPGVDVLRDQIVMTATSVGFFSIWMTVFESDTDMKVRFIKAFKGTENSGCFDLNTGVTITPAPNPDGLASGSKV